MALFDAFVNLDPRQIDASFALRNPPSKGVLLSHEVAIAFPRIPPSGQPPSLPTTCNPAGAA